VSVTVVPRSNEAEQFVPQLIPAGELVTVPLPAPDFVTLSASDATVPTIALPPWSTATHSLSSGQEIATMAFETVGMSEPSTWLKVQVPPPPSGSLDCTTFPPLPPPAQKLTSAHESETRAKLSIDATVHADTPPVGSVDVIRLSAQHPPPTTHVEVPGAQEAPLSDEPPLTLLRFVLLQAPAAGLVEEYKKSSVSTAMQSDVEAQESSPVAPLLLIAFTLQVLAGPPGSLDLAPAPLTSTATHSDVDGHDTLAGTSNVFTMVPWLVHAVAPPVGSLDVHTASLASRATQNVPPGTHDTVVKEAEVSTDSEDHAEAPPAGSLEVMTSPPATATHSDADGQEMLGI
jgi:hypothetical protein